MRHTLRQLEVFVAVARSGSVTRAAAELALSQSAASTALIELERQFDCQLFDRAGKSLRLNELGRQVLPRAMEMLDRAAEIEDILGGRSGSGSLSIGATLTVGNYLAPLLAAAWLRRHPESRLRLEVHNTAAIVGQVVNFGLDLGLIEGDCHHPDLDVQPWVEDELVVFAPPEHPLARRGQAGREDLLAETWILREAGSGTRETFDHAFRNQHARLRIGLELEHTEAIKRAVESGLGIGCISRLALREAFRRRSLAPIETPELDLSRQFQFIRHRSKYQTAGLREFLDLCRSVTAGITRSDEIELPYIR